MAAPWSFAPVCGRSFWWVLVTSPEVLVFMFFMITDPKTSPAGRVRRVVSSCSASWTRVGASSSSTPGTWSALWARLAGGDAADFARAEPVLKHLGMVIHCGGLGTGNVVKLEVPPVINDGTHRSLLSTPGFKTAWSPEAISFMSNVGGAGSEVMTVKAQAEREGLLAGAYLYHVWSYILLAASTDVRAAAILPLCLPSCDANGRYYDFPSRSLMDFRGPA